MLAGENYESIVIAGSITTIAGSVKGDVDGNGLNASFYGPSAISINPHDECLYVCDLGNEAIRKLTLQGIRIRESMEIDILLLM